MRNTAIIVTVIGVLAFAGPLRAAEGEGRVRLRVGPIAVHPVLTISESYDDNVFRTRTSTEADLVTRYLPGLRLRLPVRDHTASLEYRADIARHARFSSEDTTDHVVTGAVQVVTPRGQPLGLSYTYRRGHDPRGTAQNTALDLYTVNTASVEANPLIGRAIRLHLDYAAAAILYDEARNQFRNHRDQSAGLDLFFGSRPRHRASSGIGQWESGTT